jgi:hypothetical protein
LGVSTLKDWTSLLQRSGVSTLKDWLNYDYLPELAAVAAVAELVEASLSKPDCRSQLIKPNKKFI